MKLFVARDEVPQHVLAMGSVDEELVLAILICRSTARRQRNTKYQTGKQKSDNWLGSEHRRTSPTQEAGNLDGA